MSDKPTELLTAEEREVVDLAGQLWNKLCKVVGQGKSRDADLREAVIHVHALQQFVLSQAAARAYPDLYRPLGGWPEEDTP